MDSIEVTDVIISQSRFPASLMRCFNESELVNLSSSVGLITVSPPSSSMISIAASDLCAGRVIAILFLSPMFFLLGF